MRLRGGGCCWSQTVLMCSQRVPDMFLMYAVAGLGTGETGTHTRKKKNKCRDIYRSGTINRLCSGAEAAAGPRTGQTGTQKTPRTCCSLNPSSPLTLIPRPKYFCLFLFFFFCIVFFSFFVPFTKAEQLADPDP
jgi:hypothetical protein